MSKTALPNNPIIKWFQKLADEVSNSPLGAIGLFVGLFGLCIAILTSWEVLLSWLASAWKITLLSFAFPIATFAILHIFRKRSSKNQLDESAARALQILRNFANGRVRSICKDEALERLKSDFPYDYRELFDLLVERKKISYIYNDQIEFNE